MFGRKCGVSVEVDREMGSSVIRYLLNHLALKSVLLASVVAVFSPLSASPSDESFEKLPSAERDEFLQAGPLASSPKDLREFLARLDKVKKPKPADDEERVDPSIDHLVKSTFLHFSADGKVRVITWSIIRVLKREAATEASQLFADWSPWRMTRPRFNARVINPDGKVLENDGSGAFEQSANDGQDAIHTDQRQLTLLLSGVASGSIIESKIVYDVSPILGKAYVKRYPLTDYYPFRIHAVIVTADDGVSPQIQSIGTPVDLVESSDANEPAFRRVYETKDPPGVFRNFETRSGPDRCSFPVLIVGRPGKWEELGKLYAQAVEKSIQQGNSVVRKIASSAGDDVRNGTTLEKAKWAQATIRQLVRYMGVEFGEHSVFPVSPDAVIQRRYGDCKDQACLLVGLLRELNVEAHVSLISAGKTLDVCRDIPGVDLFNHAIAYIEKPGLWVDMTAEVYPVDLLPPIVRGRRTLVCREGGSELLTTPTYDRSVSRDIRIDRYLLNFTGGGHGEVDVHSFGDAALNLRLGYEDQPANELVASWSEFFVSHVGVDGVASLRRCSLGEQEYAVQARSEPTQVFTRELETSKALWDCRRILREIPAPLTAYAETGPGDVSTSARRTLPVHFNSGLTRTDGIDIRLPTTVTASDLPNNWKRQFGQFTISATFQRGKTVDLARPIAPTGKWTELVTDAKELSAEELAAYDSTIKVRYTITIDPGKMSASSVNECAKFLAGLYDEESALTGKIDLNWEALSKYNQSPSEETFRKFLHDAVHYRALEEPFIGLLSELASKGLGDFARSKVADIENFRPHQSFSTVWLPGLKNATNWMTDELTPDADIAGLRKLFANQPYEFQDRNLHLYVMLTEENAERTADPKKIAKAWEFASRWFQEPSFERLPPVQQGSVYAILIRTGLALKKDEEVLSLIDGWTFDFLNSPLRSIIRKEDKVDFSGVKTPNLRDLLPRTVWESLICANRFDLAVQYQKMMHEAGTPLRLKLEGPKQPELSSDNGDPESVARRALVAWLGYDIPTARLLFTPSTNIEEHIGGPSYGPATVHSWFFRERTARSSSLVKTKIALMPATVDYIGEYSCVVKFSGTLVHRLPKEPSNYEMLLVKDPAANEWRVLQSEYLVGGFLVSLCRADKHDAAAKILDHIAPPAGGFLGFMSTPETIPARKLWRSLHKLEPKRRVELVARVMAAEESNDLESLELWLKSSGIELSSSQEDILNSIRIGLWYTSGRYEDLYDHCLNEVKESRSDLKVKRLLSAIWSDRVNGGERSSDEEWKNAIGDYMDGDISQQTTVEFLFAKGQHKRGFERLRLILNQERDESTANTLLWRSLVTNESQTVLKERLEKVEAVLPFTGEESVEYRHTLACAHARCGNAHTALTIMPSLVSLDLLDRTSNALARGLILEEIGFHGDAREMFEFAVSGEPYSESAAIARIALQRLSAGSQSEIEK